MTHGTPAEPRSWAVQFPDNLRWTNAMQIVKGMAPYAAVAMDEVDRVGRRLEGRAGEADLDQVWREEWAAMADRVAAVADKAAAEGRQITAGHHYMRAGNYYYSAERFIPPGAEKMAMYRKALRAYQAAMERLHPDIERVEVPYEGTSLPAYFVAGAASGRRPTVVLFDGMDNAKEMSVIFAGLDLAKRGINTLAIDGPGQAEALRLRNIHSRHDYEVAGTAAYDYVASRAQVDPTRVAVMGYSFGGYQAPRIAAFTTGSPVTRRGSQPTPAPAPPRSSNFAGSWTRRTMRPRSNGRRSSRSRVSPSGSNARFSCCTVKMIGSSRSRRPRSSTSGLARSASTSRFSPPRKAAPSTARSITVNSASITSATGSSPTCKALRRRYHCDIWRRRRSDRHVIQWHSTGTELGAIRRRIMRNLFRWWTAP